MSQAAKQMTKRWNLKVVILIKMGRTIFIKEHSIIQTQKKLVRRESLKWCHKLRRKSKCLHGRCARVRMWDMRRGLSKSWNQINKKKIKQKKNNFFFKKNQKNLRSVCGRWYAHVSAYACGGWGGGYPRAEIK